jgi:hypothetical protein
MERDREVGTNPREGRGSSRGERGAEIGNRLPKHRTVPNQNQLLVPMLADSEGGRVGTRKLCRLSSVMVGIVMKGFLKSARRGCRKAAQRIEPKTI